MISTAPTSNNYLELQMSPVWEMNADSFFDFCQLNSHLMNNGVSLGWLIDRPNRQAYIYTPGKNAQCLDNPSTVDNDSLLPGFSLDLTKIW